MWEIFSGGKAPYPGIDPLTLAQRLEEGDRMPKPNNTACTEQMWDIFTWECCDLRDVKIQSNSSVICTVTVALLWNNYARRYGVMKRCWDILPVNRPTFRQLHIHTSRFVERIAGYLEVGYNPFAVGGEKGSVPKNDEAGENESQCGFEDESLEV